MDGIKILPKKLLLLNLFLLVALLVCLNVIWKNNHLPQTNKITDQEQIKIAQDLSHKCQNSTSWHDCYKTELAQLTKAYGLQTGVGILNKLQTIDSNSRNCHVIAHFMSREALKRDPGNLDALLDELDVNACGSGFLHGVLEAYVGLHPEIKLQEFANQVCDRGTDYRKRMCAHFMGHVFLLNTEGNLDQAIGLCHQLKDSWLFDCLDGGFMEDHQKLALVEHEVAKLPPLDDKYIKLMETRCAISKEEIESRACWTEMAEMYAHTYGYDPAIIYKDCLQAKSLQDKRACYGKGVVVMSVYQGFDVSDKIASLCASYRGKTNDEQWCTGTLLSSLIYYSPKFIDRGITACNSVSDQIKNWCLQELSRQIKIVMPDANSRLNLCDALNDADKKICVEYEI